MRRAIKCLVSAPCVSADPFFGWSSFYICDFFASGYSISLSILPWTPPTSLFYTYPRTSVYFSSRIMSVNVGPTLLLLGFSLFFRTHNFLHVPYRRELLVAGSDAVRHRAAVGSECFPFRGFCDPIHDRCDNVALHCPHYICLSERCLRCARVFAWDVVVSHHAFLPKEI